MKAAANVAHRQQDTAAKSSLISLVEAVAAGAEKYFTFSSSPEGVAAKKVELQLSMTVCAPVPVPVPVPVSAVESLPSDFFSCCWIRCRSYCGQ
jgi:hypothetical protein